MWIFARMRPAVLFVITLGAASTIAYAQSQDLSLNQIVSRMEQARAAERQQNVAYMVKREYQLSAAGAAKATADVVADVSFFPPTEKQYVIVKSEGNDRGAGIVRRILDHEVAMANHWQPHEVSSANYDFALLGREVLDGRDCYVLQLTPKREAVELLRGKAWVDAANFSIRRIEGETAKSPSFWVKNLKVTINYGQVNGVWLETSTQAVADVRLAGTHVLTSRELDVQTASLTARATKPAVPRRNRDRVVADTAAWVAH
jgi:Outer membrane lipoprotein-sorting protein